MYNLEGRVALVTGAGGMRGLGRAIALRLAREGCDVAVSDLDPARQAFSEEARRLGWKGQESVAQEISALGRRSLALSCDVTKSSEVLAMADRVVRELGKIDILVNNAGFIAVRNVPVVDLAEEDWNRTVAVDLTGVFLCCKAVVRGMIKRGEGGRIINISSRLGKVGAAGSAAYSAAKFGVIGLTQSLALELAPHNIHVHAVCPGRIDTDLRLDWYQGEAQRLGVSLEEAKRRTSAQRIAMIPLGRLGAPEDVARVVAFLCSGEADYMTGQAINVTGGHQFA